MIIWGLSYGHHDAAAAVFHNGELVGGRRFFNKTISQSDINQLINKYGHPDKIIIHENKWRDLWRKVKTGDWYRLFDGFIKLPVKPIYCNHHLSHASYGYYTSPFTGPAFVIVADAVGELETLAVYKFDGRQHQKIYQLQYPNSIGLFYSYHTARLDFMPNGEEYKVMELAKYGGSTYDDDVRSSVWFDRGILLANQPLHLRPSADQMVFDPVKRADTAATVQAMTEEYFMQLLTAMYITQKDNVVFAGGVAYNTSVVAKIRERVANLYVPRFPGDAGSALGCVLDYHKVHVDERRWI